MPVSRYTVGKDVVESVVMAKQLDAAWHVEEIEIDETAVIAVEQADDEISVMIASVVGVSFQLTADQALKLSRALAVAAENAKKFLASGDAEGPQRPVLG